MSSFPWSAFIGAVGSISQSVINNNNQKKINSENIANQYAVASSAWSKYNSPVAQKVALEQAGLNPNLINGAQSQQIGMSQSTFTPSQIDFNALASSYYQNKLLKEQIEGVRLDNEAKSIDNKHRDQNWSLDLESKSILNKRNVYESSYLSWRLETELPHLKYMYQNDEKMAEQTLNNFLNESRLFNKRIDAEVLKYSDSFIRQYVNNEISQENIRSMALQLASTQIKGSQSEEETYKRTILELKNRILKMDGWSSVSSALTLLTYSLATNPTQALDIVGKFVNLSSSHK
ncbi:minor capsid protein [Capybara microvirus Cap1_SP_92]|nr:minor capsid protein [Capybara microvirus Cap1_SP_92]